MGLDIFRPNAEPARTLYDALQKEASKRCGRSPTEWQCAERHAVWSAARDYAQQYGLPVPTLAEVEREENLACWHIDYGAKWARGISRMMTETAEAAGGGDAIER